MVIEVALQWCMKYNCKYVNCFSRVFIQVQRRQIPTSQHASDASDMIFDLIIPASSY